MEREAAEGKDGAGKGRMTVIGMFWQRKGRDWMKAATSVTLK